MLPEEWARQLQAIENDPEPKELAAGVHFPTSNEIRFYLWKDVIQDIGGMLIGVGTDQNYFMAGWAKPEILVLLDFDQLVVDLHLIYRAAFLAADTPDKFLKLWNHRNAKSMVQLLEVSLPDEKLRKRIVTAFKAWRRAIEIRMFNQRKWHKENKIKTFLDDQAQFDVIADLFRNNRVLAVRGDLTATKTMRQLGALATRMGVPVRVLYLSNAERYFAFSEDYKQNIYALPFDEKSLVLRTTGLGSWKNGDPFYYLYQKAQNFLQWLKDPSLVRVKQLLPYRVEQKQRFLYSIDRLPPTPDELKPPPKKKPIKGKKPAKESGGKAQEKPPTKKDSEKQGSLPSEGATWTRG